MNHENMSRNGWWHTYAHIDKRVIKIHTFVIQPHTISFVPPQMWNTLIKTMKARGSRVSGCRSWWWWLGGSGDDSFLPMCTLGHRLNTVNKKYRQFYGKDCSCHMLGENRKVNPVVTDQNRIFIFYFWSKDLRTFECIKEVSVERFFILPITAKKWVPAWTLVTVFPTKVVQGRSVVAGFWLEHAAFS